MRCRGVLRGTPQPCSRRTPAPCDLARGWSQVPALRGGTAERETGPGHLLPRAPACGQTRSLGVLIRRKGPRPQHRDLDVRDPNVVSPTTEAGDRERDRWSPNPGRACLRGAVPRGRPQPVACAAPHARSGGCRIQFAPDTAQAWAPSRAEEVAAARPRGSARPHRSPLLLPTPQRRGLSWALGKSELHRILGALSGLRGKAAWNPIFQTPLSRRGAGPAWGRGADGDRGGLEKGRGRLLLPLEQEAVSCRPFWNVPPRELFLEAASPRHPACAPPP